MEATGERTPTEGCDLVVLEPQPSLLERFQPGAGERSIVQEVGGDHEPPSKLRRLGGWSATLVATWATWRWARVQGFRGKFSTDGQPQRA